MFAFCRQELPASIGRMKQLSNLNVDRNRITEIPKEVGPGGGGRGEGEGGAPWGAEGQGVGGSQGRTRSKKIQK